MKFQPFPFVRTLYLSNSINQNPGSTSITQKFKQHSILKERKINYKKNNIKNNNREAAPIFSYVLTFLCWFLWSERILLPFFFPAVCVNSFKIYSLIFPRKKMLLQPLGETKIPLLGLSSTEENPSLVAVQIERETCKYIDKRW